MGGRSSEFTLSLIKLIVRSLLICQDKLLIIVDDCQLGQTRILLHSCNIQIDVSLGRSLTASKSPRLKIMQITNIMCISKNWHVKPFMPSSTYMVPANHTISLCWRLYSISIHLTSKAVLLMRLLEELGDLLISIPALYISWTSSPTFNF